MPGAKCPIAAKMRNFAGSTGYQGGDYKYLLSSSTAVTLPCDRISIGTRNQWAIADAGSPSKINWTERRGRVSRVRKYTKKIIVHWDGNAAPQSDALPAKFFERAD